MGRGAEIPCDGLLHGVKLVASFRKIFFQRVDDPFLVLASEKLRGLLPHGLGVFVEGLDGLRVLAAQLPDHLGEDVAELTRNWFDDPLEQGLSRRLARGDQAFPDRPRHGANQGRLAEVLGQHVPRGLHRRAGRVGGEGGGAVDVFQALAPRLERGVGPAGGRQERRQPRGALVDQARLVGGADVPRLGGVGPVLDRPREGVALAFQVRQKLLVLSLGHIIEHRGQLLACDGSRCGVHYCPPPMTRVITSSYFPAPEFSPAVMFLSSSFIAFHSSGCFEIKLLFAFSW